MNTPANPSSSIAITGLGVVSALGVGAEAFAESLFAGRTRFAPLARPGRTISQPIHGAELPADAVPQTTGLQQVDRLASRCGSLTAQAALQTCGEAWLDAKLDQGRVPSDRIGFVVGGMQGQPREDEILRDRYRDKLAVMRPNFAASCWDTHLLGLLSEAFGVTGECLTVGGASAAGAVAVIQAARQILVGAVDVCVAVGALCDLSKYELQAFWNLGALGDASAGRPFDVSSGGFLPGEGCAAIVLEREDASLENIRARWLGGCIASEGKHGPTPNSQTQQRAIRGALQQAGLTSDEVDYVNAHGTGAPMGDAAEAETIRQVGLQNAWINATKSLAGHCLTAAGAVEIAAVVLQLQAGRLHPTAGLETPVDPSLRWVRGRTVETELRVAVSNSFAFGGINASMALAAEAEPPY